MSRKIRYFDLFSGVGGFRAGLLRAGGFECAGHCEIDKFANRSYKAIHNIKESEIYYEDIRNIQTKTMPDFDLLCAGFPCQSFSTNGKRRGFKDKRGSLFFEIARVAKDKRPAYILLENVPGLLFHDKGKTFAKILSTLCELGYGVEWMVCNSKDFGVPQVRRRVYIVGYIDERCAGRILPERTLDAETALPAKAEESGSLANNNGNEQIKKRILKGNNNISLKILSKDQAGYSLAWPGDSIKLAFPNTIKARVGRKVCHTLDTNASKGVVTEDGRIRKLTPRECFRLQGFSEHQIDQILAVTSDYQAYKQAGNAVTVNVVEAIGRRLSAVDAELKRIGNIDQELSA